ncbi:MAG: TlpA family protein disulfide reductase [Thermoanaerobaculia bacterium]
MRKAIALSMLLLWTATAFAEEADTVRVWSEGGYERAERRTAGGELVWYVVLRPSVEGRKLETKKDGEVVRIVDGEVVRIFDMTVPRIDPSQRRALPRPAFVVQRAVPSGERTTIDLVKSGFTLAEESGNVAIWKRDVWYYAAFGPRNAPDVVLRLLVARGNAKPQLGDESGRRFATMMGIDALDDGTMTIASPMPTWLGDELRETAARREAVRSGKALPPITAARWVNSEAIDLASLRGKVVLVDFWGVWCMPCVAAIPELEQLAKDFKDQPFQLVAVHTAMQAERLDDFLKKRPFNVPIAVDTGSTQKAYGIEAFPTYVLLDKDGNVVFSGERKPSAEEIRKLF